MATDKERVWRWKQLAKYWRKLLNEYRSFGLRFFAELEEDKEAIADLRLLGKKVSEGIQRLMRELEEKAGREPNGYYTGEVASLVIDFCKELEKGTPKSRKALPDGKWRVIE